MLVTPLLYAIGAMALWGLWTVFADIGTKTTAPQTTAFLISGIGTLIQFGVVLYDGHPLIPETSSGSLYILLAGVCSAGASLAYYIALGQSNEGSLVSTVGALYFVIPIVVGILVFGETISVTQGLGLLCAGIAVVLLTL